MMKRLRTKIIWSEYSLKRHNEIKSISRPCDMQKAYMKNNGNVKEIEIEEAILETFKYAPNQHGGINYKVPEQKKKEIVQEETNSDCLS
ncbi:hypothetical protein ACJMK2_019629 [Sinanodonta woodiana]|uniref:Uncharacterized protein n=1 Tax=Sinanodonta woodiana TaxID=1069815 RepID=A0ABD3TWJ7_SINWO